MTRDFIFGSICCAGLLCLMGSTSQQISSDFKNAPQLYNELIQMRKDIDDNRFKILTTTPTPSMLVEGQGIVVSGGVKTLILKIDGSTYNVILNKN